MATPMSAQQFLHLLQAWKIPYREVGGWPTRNRNSVGPWGPVHGILLHHTGDDAPDDADTRVLTEGRSDLPGPLCHWGMRDNGQLVCIGWGRANHAGRGAANVLAALVADRPVPKPGKDSEDGNRYLYGQETMYSGRKPMTPAAYLSTVTIFAAICTFHGWSAEAAIGHREWTTRKIDPGSLDMDEFRADVARAIKAGPPKPVAPPAVKDESTGTGDAMGDREILKYGGKAYERRGFFIRYIDDVDELRDLTNNQKVPARDAGIVDFRGLVDVGKLEAKLQAAYAGVADLTQQVKDLTEVVNSLMPQPVVPDPGASV